eukprot:6105057-Prymnesium_polylepis.1
MQLAHGWHTIGVAGGGGRTSFFVDGRRVGVLPAQVASSNLLWLGNHPAEGGRRCGAVGGLLDVRVYGDCLEPAAMRELEAAAGVPGWGGVAIDTVGVWGVAGARPSEALSAAFDFSGAVGGDAVREVEYDGEGGVNVLPS